jgi:hypothetical protein
MKYLSMKFPPGEGVETCSEGKPTYLKLRGKTACGWIKQQLLKRES